MGAYCKHLKHPANCETCKREISSVSPTLSIRPYQNESGTFSVELHAHGLSTAEMAEKLANMLTAFMAGNEIKSH